MPPRLSPLGSGHTPAGFWPVLVGVVLRQLVATGAPPFEAGSQVLTKRQLAMSLRFRIEVWVDRKEIGGLHRC